MDQVECVRVTNSNGDLRYHPVHGIRGIVSANYQFSAQINQLCNDVKFIAQLVNSNTRESAIEHINAFIEAIEDSPEEYCEHAVNAGKQLIKSTRR